MSLNEVHHRVRFGPYEADLQTLELWKHGIRIKLSGQPFQILKVLLNQPGKLITREELRTQLWPEDTFVDFNHGLNAAVNKLRDALTDSADDPKYIETLPRRGYRFIGQVEPVETQQAARTLDPAPELTMPEEVEANNTVPVEPVIETPSFPQFKPLTTHEPWRKKLVFWGIGTCVVFVVAILLLIHNQINPNSTRAGDSTPTVENLVLLPDPVSDPALSRDGNRLAFIRHGLTPTSAGIFVKDIDNNQVVQLTKSAGDCCPAWSPDGNWIAFTRTTDYQRKAIYMLPSSGGQEQQVSPKNAIVTSGELLWTSDGRSIVFSGGTQQGSNSLYLLALDSLEARTLTNPPAGAVDWGPAFSPTGEQLAFVRQSPDGFPEEIMLVSSMGGEARQLTNDGGRIVSPPTWTSDGQSIVYARAIGNQKDNLGIPMLRKVSISGEDQGVISNVGENVRHPSASRRGFRLAYQQIQIACRITKIDLTESGSSQPQAVITSPKGRNQAPQLSPDGQRLVYMSDRTGAMEIWLSNADGTNQSQITALGNAGTPRWSPDGRTIAFDTIVDGRPAIYLISADGGEPRPLVKDGASNMVPSFSRDGKWVYFSSDRNGDWQIWKAPSQGGAPVQVTTHGGFAAIEGPDYLYYATSRYPDPEIWRVPLAGGREERLAPRVVPRIWASWTVTDRGILFAEQLSGELNLYDFKSQQISRVMTPTTSPFWLAASQDGKTVWMEQEGQEQSAIMMIKNFH